MNKTNIEYLDYSWNAIAMRCMPVSSACKDGDTTHCWHLRMADRLAKNQMIPKEEREAYAGGPPVLRERELYSPLRKREPARIGVQFMGDLFHNDIPDDMIELVWESMEASGFEHVFLFLTKRVERMNKWFSKRHEPIMEGSAIVDPNFPDSRIWLGVSVEDQKTADERIPILLQTPAAHRWVSYEPALSPVNFSPWLSPCGYYCDHDPDGGGHRPDKAKIDWLVVGGETGPHARPLHPGWVRSVVKQCKTAKVPVFVKQLSGKDAKDMSKWPEDLRIRELPI